MHIKTIFAIPVFVFCAIGLFLMLCGIAIRLMFGGEGFMPELQFWSCVGYLLFGVPAGLIAYGDRELRRLLGLR